MFSHYFLDFFVGIVAFVRGLSQISSFFLLRARVENGKFEKF